MRWTSVCDFARRSLTGAYSESVRVHLGFEGDLLCCGSTTSPLLCGTPSCMARRSFPSVDEQGSTTSPTHEHVSIDHEAPAAPRSQVRLSRCVLIQPGRAPWPSTLQ